MSTKLKLSGTPTRHPNLHLSDPIWTVKHLAKAFNVTEDRARRHTYRPSFPRPKQGFDTNLYCREAVLAWFRELDDVPLTPAMKRRTQASVNTTQGPPQRTTVRSPAPTPPAAERSTTARAGSKPKYQARRGR